jgi:hypothetical protein
MDSCLSTICSLNEDVLLGVFEHLDYEELVQCEAVCRQWREILLCEPIWKLHYELSLPSPPSIIFLHLSAESILIFFSLKGPAAASVVEEVPAEAGNDSIQCQSSAVIIRLRVPLLTFYSCSIQFFRRTICNFLKSVDGYLPPQVQQSDECFCQVRGSVVPCSLRTRSTCSFWAICFGLHFHGKRRSRLL